jgi:hypothetical protein
LSPISNDGGTKETSIVVLSLYRPRLEDFLTARGQKIIALIPEIMRHPRESATPG